MTELLRELNNVPFEKWPIKLKAVSANADGRVNSGITQSGVYFFRKWSADFQTSELVVDK